MTAPRPRRVVLESGERHGNATISDVIVLSIRSLWLLEALPFAHIARIYGLSRDRVWRICRGRNWRHLSEAT